MAKIPVGATIAQAYRFAFGDFLKILGVMWPSMLLMWLPSLLMRKQMTALSAQMAAQDFSSLRELWPLILLFYLVALVLIIVQVIGIAQLALGRHKGPVWFYFELGKPVWRLIGSFLLLILAFIIGWIATLLGAFILGFILALITKAVNSAAIAIGISVLAVIALFCAFVYCWIRLTFLLIPVVAAQEEGLALGRSWTLGLSNFWRMFAILLATVGPFIILEFVFIFGFMFKGIAFPPPHATADQMAAYQAAMNARSAEMMNGIYSHWYIAYPLALVFVVVFYGLAVGAQCFAYRALTEGEASAPVAAN
jgi:hypothetical protein